MEIEDLRQRLIDTIFRKRRRPTIEELTLNQDVLSKGPGDVSSPKGWETVIAAECCQASFQNVSVTWNRVKLTLHDEGDPSQVELSLTLARKEFLRIPCRTVVLLHGTGGCSSAPTMLHHAAHFIAKDFMVVLLNSRYHGCRAGEKFIAKERYTAELVKAWRTNLTNGISPCYPFIYDTCADLVSVADYLLSRPDVRGESLGIAGISLGGMHAWFASAADERWKAVAPLIGVQSFRYAVENECFHARVETIREVFDAAASDEKHETVGPATVMAVWNRICPDLLKRFDAEFSLPLLYPRPVFIANGELDPRCPIEGVRAAVEKSANVCIARHGDPGNIELHVFSSVAHEITEEMLAGCVEFFSRVFPAER